MKTTLIPTTPEHAKLVNGIFEAINERIYDLRCRWQDEREFEDFADYADVMKKLLPENATFIKATKSPFGVQFILKENGYKYAVIAKARSVEWKRVR